MPWEGNWRNNKATQVLAEIKAFMKWENLDSTINPPKWIQIYDDYMIKAIFLSHFLNYTKLILEGVHQWEFIIPLEN